MLHIHSLTIDCESRYELHILSNKPFLQICDACCNSTDNNNGEMTCMLVKCVQSMRGYGKAKANTNNVNKIFEIQAW